MAEDRKAVVLLSGGLDSATVMALARAQGFSLYALSVSYGQRHIAELVAARRLAEHFGVRAHQTLQVNLDMVGGSALTDRSIAVPEAAAEGIPVTYVPARNTLFLSLALGWAEVVGAEDLFIGVNAVDYSGYPDCRPAFIDAFERLAAVATRGGVEGRPVRVQAPLMQLTKGEIIRAGTALQVPYELTVSCYQADDDGRACGRCDSCRLRREGFRAAAVDDPTRYV
ncbi:7-cyano-7-deazaguanine synthase QueC [Flagellatimonas centrodinii]|uniref:7-cyano-7-deazaguanine synthase QueC n=1 Tax=Flagellatimonas centrodinii TaxID=2806210 RepID=UPI001FEF4C8C|nr:7-cyano-7-deazaguanine synthase QueC [Flagellatimonas centrodinii]ULQ46469.1 7-cyano-7-deazaguanine synthase QueC [Flagellatimonas centrodinii]